MDELVIYVCTDDSATQEQVMEEIEEKVLLSTELKPHAIEFLPREELVKRLGLETENKDRRIIDARPKE